MFFAVYFVVLCFCMFLLCTCFFCIFLLVCCLIWRNKEWLYLLFYYNLCYWIQGLAILWYLGNSSTTGATFQLFTHIVRLLYWIRDISFICADLALYGSFGNNVFWIVLVAILCMRRQTDGRADRQTDGGQYLMLHITKHQHCEPALCRWDWKSTLFAFDWESS